MVSVLNQSIAASRLFDKWGEKYMEAALYGRGSLSDSSEDKNDQGILRNLKRRPTSHTRIRTLEYEYRRRNTLESFHSDHQKKSIDFRSEWGLLSEILALKMEAVSIKEAELAALKKQLGIAREEFAATEINLGSFQAEVVSRIGDVMNGLMEKLGNPKIPNEKKIDLIIEFREHNGMPQFEKCLEFLSMAIIGNFSESIKTYAEEAFSNGIKNRFDGRFMKFKPKRHKIGLVFSYLWKIEQVSSLILMVNRIGLAPVIKSKDHSDDLLEESSWEGAESDESLSDESRPTSVPEQTLFAESLELLRTKYTEIVTSAHSSRPTRSGLKNSIEWTQVMDQAINGSDILKNGKRIAKTLMIHRSECFSAISMDQLASNQWKKGSDPSNKDLPIAQCIQLSNQISQLVEANILEGEMRSGVRAKKIELWIAAAQQCFIMGSFQDAFDIYLGVASANIQNLKSVWIKIDVESMKKFNLLSEVFKLDHNMINYRKYINHMEHSKKEHVPLLGVILKDLTFCEDGNNPEKKLEVLNRVGELIVRNKMWLWSIEDKHDRYIPISGLIDAIRNQPIVEDDYYYDIADGIKKKSTPELARKQSPKKE